MRTIKILCKIMRLGERSRASSYNGTKALEQTVNDRSRPMYILDGIHDNEFDARVNWTAVL